MSVVSKTYNTIRLENRDNADIEVSYVTDMNSGTMINDKSTEDYTGDSCCQGSSCSYTPERNRRMLFISEQKKKDRYIYF